MWKRDIISVRSSRRRRCSIRGLALALSALLLAAVPVVAGAGSLPRNWPMAPSQLEARFRQQDFVIREAKDAGSGVTGASKLLIEYPDGKTLSVKWKAAPPGSADAFNNSPRKELAAYQVQKWLFDENDFVVPTVALLCLPMEKARAIDANAAPTFPGTSCVLGTISVWMQDVSAPKDAYERERFERDPLYAHYLADLNVLTYVIGHRDSHKGNLLVSNDAGDPRVYAVDNGIAFDLVPWNLLVFNWFKIRVPWLRRETIDRLRRVDKSEARALEVVAEFEVDANGVLQLVPSGPRLAESGRDRVGLDRVRKAGHRIQLGLDEDELDDIRERIEKLVDRVDKGRQPVR